MKKRVRQVQEQNPLMFGPSSGAIYAAPALIEVKQANRHRELVAKQ